MMKLKILFALLTIAVFSPQTSIEDKETNYETVKSLKILNIHDTTGPKTLLA